VLVDNFPFPVSPLKPDGGVDGAFLTNYMAKALADVNAGLVTVLSTNSTVSQLIGKVPVHSAAYPVTIVDVYVVDPEGMTNGMAANIPELPYGFVQGKTHLGSFTVTSTDGTFNQDISSWGVTPTTLLTATASYSKSPAGTHNAETLTGPFADPVRPKQSLLVTTAASSGPGSLLAALTAVQNGDTIAFNIPGAGPHYIATPAGGYPYITANNITIDGYTQPGAVPNSNPILAANNAQIKIVLDSRNGNTKVMDYAGDTPNDDTGYGDGESAILGVLSATNVTIKGLCMIAVPLTGPATDVSVYAVAFAKGANGHIAGCRIGVDLNGQSGLGYGPADAVTGFRYRGRDENNTVTNTILVSGVTIGVGKTSVNARAEFNVITSIPAIPIILEGENHRISGNFLNVMPDGLHDYNPAFDPVTAGFFEGNIEIGRAGNNTVIGTDGDGVNDAEERNVFSGAVPPSLEGYEHNIEFYGQTPGTNIVIAGNYIGIGVDGVTRFTNGVPALNAGGGTAQYRFGSDFDGVSDAVEGNVVYNNWPPSLFPASDWDPTSGTVPPSTLNFFDELSTGASVSGRGNVLVDNFPFPVSPLKPDRGV
jgi:hypothetical protein